MVNSSSFLATDSHSGFDPYRTPTPCFVVDEVALESNLKILNRVERESGAKVLLALKAFSMFSLAPLIMNYLTGVCASGPYEAKLGHEEFVGMQPDKEVHCFSPAYSDSDSDMASVLKYANHVVFNSFGQWQRHKKIALTAARNKHIEFGLRINPQHSEGHNRHYNPCSPGSRMGITRSHFKNEDLTHISGLHFHTLCEQGFEPLARTLNVIEQQFADILPSMHWINFGGGHHITAPGYNVDGLIDRIQEFSERYQVQVYLEPGEAVAIRCGVLICEVLDVLHNDGDIAIINTSATNHMPDIIEMPYRPNIFGAGKADEKKYNYRIGGQTCLAGDVFGEYSFDRPLQIGQRLVLDDMAHYTMVKTTTFNGIPLPAIAIWNSTTDALRIVKEFGYQDFKQRLS